MQDDKEVDQSVIKEDYESQLKNLKKKMQQTCPAKYVTTFTKNLITQNEFWKDYQVSQESFRASLPCKRDPNAKIDLWSIMKEAVGKDLTKFTLPGTLLN